MVTAFRLNVEGLPASPKFSVEGACMLLVIVRPVVWLMAPLRVRLWAPDTSDEAKKPDAEIVIGLAMVRSAPTACRTGGAAELAKVRVPVPNGPDGVPPVMELTPRRTFTALPLSVVVPL